MTADASSVSNCFGTCLDSGDAIADDDKDDLPGLEGLATTPPSDAIVGPSGRIYYSTALCGLAIWQQPRRACISVVEYSHFDTLILCTIIANCATMAWESPLDPPGTWKATFIDGCEWAFLLIFTAELLAKVVAFGLLFAHGAYLRDAWCQLDFVVVTLAWIPIIVPSFGNYSVIRSVRALRPLRALRILPGMPVLVRSILEAIPKMTNVAMLCGFVFLIFGILGMELFKGSLHYRCALPGFAEGASAEEQAAFEGHPAMY